MRAMAERQYLRVGSDFVSLELSVSQINGVTSLSCDSSGVECRKTNTAGGSDLGEDQDVCSSLGLKKSADLPLKPL